MKHIYYFFSLFSIFTLMSFTLSTVNAQEPKAPPTDPEIAHIVVTANTIDINAAKLAQSKTKDPEVKAFADRMVVDHTGVNKQATDLAQKLGISPKENASSKELMKQAKESNDKLKQLKGKDFDTQYIDHEVAYHQAVLDTIDKTLIPNAKNGDLKSLLEKTRPAIAAHLEHAKKVQGSLRK